MVTATLFYPEHIEVTPSDFLVFVEVDGFLDDWHSFGLDDDTLELTQICLTGLPECGGEVSGTGGLREVKLGCVEASERTLILRYVYFPEFSKVVLFSLHEGHEELSENERGEIRELILRDRMALERRSE